jgi:hypothetical protein
MDPVFTNIWDLRRIVQDLFPSLGLEHEMFMILSIKRPSIFLSDIIQIIRKLLKGMHRNFIGRNRINSQDFKYIYKQVLRIQIRMFLDLLDPDLLVRGSVPDL